MIRDVYPGSQDPESQIRIRNTENKAVRARCTGRKSTIRRRQQYALIKKPTNKAVKVRCTSRKSTSKAKQEKCTVHYCKYIGKPKDNHFDC
jgi:hypothetical protein